MERELALHKQDLQTLADYEEHYTQACSKLKELASSTAASWEPAYNELRLRIEQYNRDGLLSGAMEYLEGFLLQSKSALTEYRREKGLLAVSYRKPSVDVTQYSKTGLHRQEMEKRVKDLQARISELVKETNREATNTLQYLRDIHTEAKEIYEALHRKVARTSSSVVSEEPKELLQAVHRRLAEAGKVRVSYSDFARLLREGRGSFTFVGKQNELAYLLLFLDRNSLSDNWKGLTLFYERNGVPVKVTPKNIVEAQKKLSSRNDPAIKNLLAGLKGSFQALIVP